MKWINLLYLLPLMVALCLVGAEKHPDLGVYTEKVKATNIPFAIHGKRLQPILPASFSFDQESGPLYENGALTCNAIERSHVIDPQTTATETVLRCGPKDAQQVFIVTGVEFTAAQ